MWKAFEMPDVNGEGMVSNEGEKDNLLKLTENRRILF